MKNRYRFIKKSYAMQRMSAAIERAIVAPTIKEKERAARWAAAWGMLCGVTTSASNLKGGDVLAFEEEGEAFDSQPAGFAQAAQSQRQPAEPASSGC
jgi:hypothetical protein